MKEYEWSQDKKRYIWTGSEEIVKPSEIFEGMKIGYWTILKFHHKNNHGEKFFLCKCEICGNTRPVRASHLLQGKSRACSQKCSLTIPKGTRFGRWVVLSRDNSRPGYYICRCDCGTIKSVCVGTLNNGQSKSCGCLSRELSKERYQKQAEETIIGKKFGKLTPIERFTKGKTSFYRCNCDCGAKGIEISHSHLMSGHTTSCGCVKSKMNMRMDHLLTAEGIHFIREYSFPDCVYKAPLRFDFALFNDVNELIGLIELNGSQHYSSRGTGWDTPERLIMTQKRDYIKQKFCEDNMIPLLIIPYQYEKEEDMKKFFLSSDFYTIISKNFND